MESSKYPFDFAAFRPGDVIEAETIERLKDCKRTDPDYRIKMVALAGAIDDGIQEEQGKEYLIKCEGDCLRILLHEEATDYAEGIFGGSLRRARKYYRKQMAVDLTELSEDKKAVHLRRLQVNGAILAAVKDTKHKLRLEAAKRPTPGLVSG